MRKPIQIYGNFEGLDADSSTKTKAPNKASNINNLWGHAGNLETRPGFVRIVPAQSLPIVDKYNQAFFLRCFSSITINHGVLIQAGGNTVLNGKLVVRHNFLRD